MARSAGSPVKTLLDCKQAANGQLIGKVIFLCANAIWYVFCTKDLFADRWYVRLFFLYAPPPQSCFLKIRKAEFLDFLSEFFEKFI